MENLNPILYTPFILSIPLLACYFVPRRESVKMKVKTGAKVRTAETSVYELTYRSHIPEILNRRKNSC
jgi:hypothetical protein